MSQSRSFAACGRVSSSGTRLIVVVALFGALSAAGPPARALADSPAVISGTVQAPPVSTLSAGAAQFADTMLDYCVQTNITTFQPSSLLAEGGQVLIVPSVCATQYEAAPGEWDALQSRLHPQSGTFDAVFGVSLTTLDAMTHGAGGFEVCNSLAFTASTMCRLLRPSGCSVNDCEYDELQVIQDLAPYLVMFGFDVADAFHTGEAVFSELQDATAWADAGCPSGYQLGMMPASFRATDASTGQLLYIEKPYCYTPPTIECESTLQRLENGSVQDILDYITDPAGFAGESACKVVVQTTFVPDVGPGAIAEWASDKVSDLGMDVVLGETIFGDPTEPSLNAEFFAEEPLADAEVQAPPPTSDLAQQSADPPTTITVADMLADQAKWAEGEGAPIALAGLINRTPSATGLVSASPYPSVVGQSVTYSAAVTSGTSSTPTGTITFADDLVPIAGCEALPVTGGNASCQTTYQSAGNHHITASYNGDANLTPSSSPGTIVQIANPAQTVTALASSPGSSVVGQSVQFTASVSVQAPGAGVPTGAVDFYDGSVKLGSATLNGGNPDLASFQTTTLNATSHTIVASYTGDGNYTASNASAITQVVNPAATTTAVSSSADPALVGQQVQFTASISVQAPGGGAPTGTVDFYDGSVKLGSATLNNSNQGLATLQTNLGLGIHSITVSYKGDSNYMSSTSAALTQYINCNLSRYPTLPGGGYGLKGANLAGCFFVNANLAGSDLKGSNLSGADLAGANLTTADLTGANLRNVVLTGTNLQGANLQGANLLGATGSAADLTSASLEGANLNGGAFGGADFHGADLTDANLQDVDLTGADLSSANANGTNLQDANLTAANLTGATTLAANFNRATWSNTTCPDGTNSNAHNGTCVAR